MATSDNYYRVFQDETGDKRSTDQDANAFMITGKSATSRLWLVLSGTISKTDPDRSVTPRIVLWIIDPFNQGGGYESKYVTTLNDLNQQEAVNLPPNQRVEFAIEGSNANEVVTLDVYRVSN